MKRGRIRGMMEDGGGREETIEGRVFKSECVEESLGTDLLLREVAVVRYRRKE